MIHVAIIGTGAVAKTHVQHWQAVPGVRIHAVADPDAARRSGFIKNLGLVGVAEVDGPTSSVAAGATVIDICSPPWLHGPQARESLEAGAHCVLEKPLTASLAEFDDLLALERGTGRRIIPVLQNRLGDGPRGLAALKAAGLTGRFLHGSAETLWRRGEAYYAAPWRGRHATEIAGPWLGLGIHLMDTLLRFLPPVQSVHGHAATLVQRIEVEDCGSALLTLAGGGFLTVTGSAHAHHEQTSAKLIFERVEVRAGGDLAPNAYSWSQTPWRFIAADPAHQARIDACLAAVERPATPPELDQLWLRQARIWADLVNGGDPAGSDLASARPAVEVASAFYAAARTRERVDLPLTTAHPNYHRLAP